MGQVISIAYQDQIYSPFSGQPADGEDGPNERDTTLLFIFYGDAGEYAYISEQFRREANIKGIGEIDEVEPETLAKQVPIENSMLLKVNAAWNGINWYCFAPPEG